MIGMLWGSGLEDTRKCPSVGFIAKMATGMPCCKSSMPAERSRDTSNSAAAEKVRSHEKLWYFGYEGSLLQNLMTWNPEGRRMPDDGNALKKDAHSEDLVPSLNRATP